MMGFANRYIISLTVFTTEECSDRQSGILR